MRSPGYSNPGNSDNESLQADVMRFMAIIGFCLVAILALVKNAEPVEAAEAPTPESAAPPVVEAPEPEPEPPAPEAPPRPAEKPHAKTFVVSRPTPEPAPAPAPAPEPEVPSAPRPEPETAVADTEEEGLSLRFASDRDFLRLVARGEIDVYAFNPETVLALGADYRFAEAPSPGQVFEMLPATIPSLVIDALHRQSSAAPSFTWGIAMPARIRREIDRHLNAGASGELIINRYGEVDHVASR